MAIETAPGLSDAKLVTYASQRFCRLWGPVPAKVRASTSLLSLAQIASLKSRPHRKPGKIIRTNDVFTAGAITA